MTIQKELKKKFIIHLVKPKETIYGLKRFYNVSQEDLLTLNPELKEGLKIGQLIKIKPIEEGEESENLIYEDIIEEDVALKVALMLPFKTREYDTVTFKKIFSKKQIGKYSNRYLFRYRISYRLFKETRN